LRCVRDLFANTSVVMLNLAHLVRVVDSEEFAPHSCRNCGPSNGVNFMERRLDGGRLIRSSRQLGQWYQRHDGSDAAFRLTVILARCTKVSASDLSKPPLRIYALQRLN
jgi:hypothetical protein